MNTTIPEEPGSTRKPNLPDRYELNQQNRAMQRNLRLIRGACTILAGTLLAVGIVCGMKIREINEARTYGDAAMARERSARAREAVLQAELSLKRQNTEAKIKAYERAYRAENPNGGLLPGGP